MHKFIDQLKNGSKRHGLHCNFGIVNSEYDQILVVNLNNHQIDLIAMLMAISKTQFKGNINRKFVNIQKKMWYDCQWDNSPQDTKMTQKLTTTGNRTALSFFCVIQSKASTKVTRLYGNNKIWYINNNKEVKYALRLYKRDMLLFPLIKHRFVKRINTKNFTQITKDLATQVL